jgi:hypothetical protein
MVRLIARLLVVLKIKKNNPRSKPFATKLNAVIITLISRSMSWLFLFLGGSFMFSLSPFLLERERQGKSSELLPKSWQNKIMVSLIISDLGWWGSLIVIIWHVVNN